MNIRPVRPEDIPDIVGLSELCGFADRSEEGLRWVLFENPSQGSEPAGYVALKDDKIMAFLGSAVRRIHGIGDNDKIIAGHTFFAHPSHPGYGIRTVKFGQENTGPRIFYTLHNNKMSSLIFKRRGMPAIWQASGRLYLKKRIRWGSVALSALLRRLAKFDKLKTHLLKREWLMTRPKSGEPPCVENVKPLDAFNIDDAASIDAFDQALAQSGKIIGSRASEIWRYRLRDPEQHTPIRLFAIEDEKGIAAMLATSITKDDELSVVTLDIEDLIFRPGAEHHLETMLLQAVKCAHHARAARIMLRVLPPNLDLATADSLGFKARPRAYDSCHFGGEVDWDPLSWEISPFDGDFWFALRRPPAR